MPTIKSKVIENVLTSLAGISRQEAEAKKECTTCHDIITVFKDKLSTREYSISGMCQDCQDRIFGV